MNISGKISKRNRKAAEYFATQLFSPQMSRNIFVEFKFTKKLEFLGLCHIVDYNDSNKPRHFLIEINKKQPEAELINTIAHELTHVSQYCYGKLNEYMTKWCGKPIDKSTIEYSDYPWEIEACENGDRLTKHFLEKMPMSMFDHITFNNELYQTKDTPKQTLDNYEIDIDQESGQYKLWHEQYEAKWVEDSGSPFGGHLTKENPHWQFCDTFTGEIRFYRSKDVNYETWEEYSAYFHNGNLKEIHLL